MAVDQITPARVVLADGSLITVSSTAHPHVCYAVREGGLYGFVIKVTMNTMSSPGSAMIG